MKRRDRLYFQLNHKMASIGAIPVNTGLPIISGTAKVGNTLSVDVGTWTNSPDTYAIQWKRAGVNIAGANGNSYVLTTTDYNTVITCGVIATNAIGPSTQAVSTGTSAVLPLPAVNTVAPNITGNVITGNTLTCTQGTWTGQGSISYTYQWQRDGVNIGGATSSTYVSQVADEGRATTCNVTATNTGGSTVQVSNTFVTSATPAPSLSEMNLITYNVTAGGTQKAIVFLPRGYRDNGNNYPTLYSYHGDGGDGSWVLVTNQNMAGSAASWTFTFATTGSQQVLWSSVVIKVSGVTVGTGRANGTIVGATISSATMAHTSAGGAVAITFTGTPGATPTIDYNYSVVFETFIPFYLNKGDEPLDLIVVITQKSVTNSNFVLARDYTDLRTYIDANFRTNTNRRYVAGLSRGGFFVRELMISSYTEIAAFLGASSTTGTGFTWANYTNRGQYWISGTDEGLDGVNPPQIAFMTSSNAAGSNVSILTRLLQGVRHTSTVWNTNVANRKERTDAPGTADWDYVRWVKKFSLDLEEQAVLITDYAVYTNLIQDYREALGYVNTISAGAVKTAQLARLATLKSTIDGSKKRYIIDFGATTSSYNSMISCALNATVSNILDDGGGASTKGFKIFTAASVSSPSGRVFDTAKLAGRYLGFEPNAYRDAARIDIAVTTGDFGFTGLNPAKTYTLRIYSATGVSISNNGTLIATVGGVQKSLYSETNTTQWMEWTGLTPNGSNELHITGIQGGNGVNAAFNIVELEEI